MGARSLAPGGLPPGGRLRALNPANLVSVIENEEHARRIQEHLLKVSLGPNQPVAFDTETSGWDPKEKMSPYSRAHCEVFSLSDGYSAWCLAGTLLGVFKPLLTAPHVDWCGVNLKFDIAVLHNHGIDLGGHWWDARLLSRLINLTTLRSHGLKEMAAHFLGVQMMKFESLMKLPKGRKPSTLDFLTLAEPLFARYSRDDAMMSVRLVELLQAEIAKISWRTGKSMKDFYTDFEEPFTHVLVRMEQRGIRVDQDRLAVIKKTVEQELDVLQNRFEQIAQGPINLRSGDQLEHLFFKKLGYEPLRFTKTRRCGLCGKKATKRTAFACGVHGVDALEPAASMNKYVLDDMALLGIPEAVLLSRVRRLDQLRKNFLPHLSRACPDGKVRTTWNQGGAESWRLCLAGDTKIVTDTDGYVELATLDLTKPIKPSTITHRGRWRRILRKFYKGVEPMLEVRLSNAAVITGTAGHRVLTPTGWRHLGDLVVGSTVRTHPGSIPKAADVGTGSIQDSGRGVVSTPVSGDAPHGSRGRAALSGDLEARDTHVPQALRQVTWCCGAGRGSAAQAPVAPKLLGPTRTVDGARRLQAQSRRPGGFSGDADQRPYGQNRIDSVPGRNGQDVVAQPQGTRRSTGRPGVGPQGKALRNGDAPQAAKSAAALAVYRTPEGTAARPGTCRLHHGDYRQKTAHDALLRDGQPTRARRTCSSECAPAVRAAGDGRSDPAATRKPEPGATGGREKLLLGSTTVLREAVPSAYIVAGDVLANQTSGRHLQQLRGHRTNSEDAYQLVVEPTRSPAFGGLTVPRSTPPARCYVGSVDGGLLHTGEERLCGGGRSLPRAADAADTRSAAGRLRPAEQAAPYPVPYAGDRAAARRCGAADLGPTAFSDATVTAVRSVGVQAVWDIEVEEDHSYVAQGFVNHNSGSSPNLMNIARPENDDPLHEDPNQRGFDLRGLFQPDPGMTFLVADMSQIELRLGAHLSGDQVMIETYRRGGDIHAEAAIALFGLTCPVEQVKDLYPKERNLAKTMNFCLPAGTRVQTLEGAVPIEQIRPGTRVYQDDGSYAPVSALIDKGRQLVLRLRLTNGLRLDATPLHRIRGIDAAGSYTWRRLHELRKGDWVAVKPGGAPPDGTVQLPRMEHTGRTSEKTMQSPDVLTEDLAAWMGYLLGDGSISSTTISWAICGDDADLCAPLQTAVSDAFGRLPACERLPRANVFIGRISSRPLTRWLTAAGFNKRHTPEFLWGAGTRLTGAFLRGLFEADGSVGSTDVSFASKHESLIDDVQQLLFGMGIVASKHGPRAIHLGEKTFLHWVLTVAARSTPLFARLVGFLSKRKQERLQDLTTALCSRSRRDNWGLPQQRQNVQKLSPAAKSVLANVLEHDTGIGHALAERLRVADVAAFNDLRLDRVVDWGLLYVRVDAVELVGERHVYDLSVPGPEAYVARGFINHNSVFYGAGVKRVAAVFQQTPERAKELINNFFARFPGIKAYKQVIEQRCRSQGYIRSLLGRIHHFPLMAAIDPKSDRYKADEDLRGRYQAEFRTATNFGCQGGAADMIQTAMLVADGEIVDWHPLQEDHRLLDLGAQMLMQIHDELVFQIPTEAAEEAKPILEQIMANPIPNIRVPITASAGTGKTWSSAKA